MKIINCDGSSIFVYGASITYSTKHKKVYYRSTMLRTVWSVDQLPVLMNYYEALVLHATYGYIVGSRGYIRVK